MLISSFFYSKEKQNVELFLKNCQHFEELSAIFEEESSKTTNGLMFFLFEEDFLTVLFPEQVY
jgi:S-methylmethionine-dependent homocysteine/selenocysteine methylase